MAQKSRNKRQPNPQQDDGQWLQALLAPVRERVDHQPSVPTVLRVRQRIWRQIARKRLPLAAA